MLSDYSHDRFVACFILFGVFNKYLWFLAWAKPDVQLYYFSSKWTSSLNCLFPSLLVFVLKILLRIVIMQKFQVSSIIHLKYANLTILVFGRSQIFRYERTCISLLLNEISRWFIKPNCIIATIIKTREN